jgi:uncharacterized protein
MGDDDAFDGCEWDERKSERCLRERDFDFAFASALFENPIYWEQPSKQEHGEPRFEVVGEVQGVMLFVVWTPRGSRRRIISARVASREERDEYRQAIEG